MRSSPRKLLACVLLLSALLVAPDTFCQCIPWQDSIVSVSQLKVPAKAHSTFLEALASIQRMDERGARNALSRALKIDGTYAAALTVAGLFALEDSRLDDASRQIKAALEVDPGYYGAFLALAAVENAKHNYEEAERLTQSVMTTCRTFWWVYYEHAESLIGMRQYAAAIATLRKAATQVTQPNPLLRIPRAYALDALHEHLDAARELEEFLKEAPARSIGLDHIRKKLASIKLHLVPEDETRQQSGAMGTE